MQKLRQIICCLGLLCATPTLFGQNAETVMTDLRATLYQINHPQAALTGRNGYLMEAEVKTVSRAKVGEEADVSALKMMISEDQVQFLADGMELYQDDEQLISIFPDRKLIMWGDAPQDEVQNSQANALVQLQDSLLSYCSLQSCETVRQGGKSFRQIILNVNEAGQERFAIRGLMINLDHRRNKVLKAKVVYTSKHELATSEITYTTIDYSHKISAQMPVLERVFARKGQLHDRYSDFRVADIRSKTR